MFTVHPPAHGNATVESTELWPPAAAGSHHMAIHEYNSAEYSTEPGGMFTEQLDGVIFIFCVFEYEHIAVDWLYFQFQFGRARGEVSIFKKSQRP